MPVHADMIASLALYERWSARDVFGHQMVAQIVDNPAFEHLDAHKVMTAYRECKAFQKTLDLSDPALRRGKPRKDAKERSITVKA